MNILFHCSEYPPLRSGGIGSITKVIAEELSQRGHNVYVCGFYPELPKGQYREMINGVHIFRFSTGSRRTKFGSVVINKLNALGLLRCFYQKELDFYEGNVQKLIDENGIDIFEITDFYEFNRCEGRLVYRSFSVPLVLRAHGSASFLNKYRGIASPMTEINDASHFKRASALSSVSKFSEDFIFSIVPKNCFKNTEVIYNSIESSFISPSQQSGSNAILYMGKLFDTKGADNTVLAFNRFLESHPGWVLRMAGSGDVERIMKIAVSKDSVQCLGSLDREHIKKELDFCSFVCLPSRFESCSMTLLETMSRNRAAISTNRTSGPELVQNGINGILVDPEDVGQISEAMSFLADNPADRARIAGNGFNRILNDMNVKKMADDCYALYSKLIRE